MQFFRIGRSGLRWGTLAACILATLIAGWKLAPHAQPRSQPSADVPVRHAGLRRLEETGRRVYISICAYCHGVNGDGFGLNAPNLAVPPRDHTDSAYMATRSDEQLFAVIKYGAGAQGKSPLMPPWGGRLSDREITALVAYLRALTRTPADHKDLED